jgi:hypothetical protein
MGMKKYLIPRESFYALGLRDNIIFFFICSNCIMRKYILLCVNRRNSALQKALILQDVIMRTYALLLVIKNGKKFVSYAILRHQNSVTCGSVEVRFSTEITRNYT